VTATPIVRPRTALILRFDVPGVGRAVLRHRQLTFVLSPVKQSLQLAHGLAANLHQPLAGLAIAENGDRASDEGDWQELLHMDLRD
jgi:hypothetical protein